MINGTCRLVLRTYIGLRIVGECLQLKAGLSVSHWVVSDAKHETYKRTVMPRLKAMSGAQRFVERSESDGHAEPQRTRYNDTPTRLIRCRENAVGVKNKS